jgi:hypothetical protein
MPRHAGRMFRSVLAWVVTLAILIGSGALAVSEVLPLLPCRQPIRYSIGEVDPRFGMSREKFAKAVEEAGGAWSQKAGKPLFLEVSKGGMIMNAVYDYRQEARQKMETLGIKVDETKKSYDQLKAKHASLDALFAKRQQEYTSLKNRFEQKKAAYEAAAAEVEQRGVTHDDVERLETMRTEINAMVHDLNTRSEQLQHILDELNAVITVLNNLGQKTNETINAYNDVGGTLDDEYDAAVYIRNVSGRKIDVFTFSDEPELKRLLMHEMGHALGLPHLQATGSVMYYLNQSKSPMLTEADVGALSERCGL